MRCGGGRYETLLPDGGTGFVGKAIIRKLLAAPETSLVIALTRDMKKRAAEMPVDPRFQLWEGDITRGHFPESRSFDFTDLIHGANDSQGKVDPNPYKLYYTMVEGTRQVLDWAERNKVYRVTFLSSGGVARDDAYGRGKQVSEFFCTHYKIHPRIARLYSTIGEEMPLNGQFAVGKFVWQALHEGRVKVVGGQGVYRSYLHADDAADWIIATHLRGSATQDYDIASARKVSIQDLARITADIFEVPFEFEEAPFVEDEYFPNVPYTMKWLDVRETITLEQSLERIKTHFRGR